MNLKQRLLKIAEDSNKGIYGVDVMMADDTDMTDDQRKKREKIIISMKDKLPELKAKYGESWQKVMYATATKLATKDDKIEESANLDELARGNDFQTPDSQFTTNINEPKVKLMQKMKKQGVSEGSLKEVSKKMLNRYVSKARDDLGTAISHSYRDYEDDEADEKDNRRAEKRQSGIDLARAKINKSGQSGKTVAKVKATEEGVSESQELDEDREGLLAKFIMSKGLDPDRMDPTQRSAYSRTRDFKIFKSLHSESIHFDDDKKEVDDVKSSPRKRIKEISASGEGGQDWNDQLKEKKIKKTMKENARLSRSALMIKEIYNKHRMNEELYDREKMDKEPATTGKKPKIEVMDDKKKPSDPGGKKPEAQVVMSGGTTMTGKPRDTIEVNPVMRNRPGQPKIGDGDKGSKNDKKK